MYNYIVNGKRFNNAFLAFYESYSSGQPITFYANDYECDKLDWTKEPEESFEVLMDRRAHQLRQQYERLVFFWSGGTDSQTIYNVFKRNNIHIDEIISMGNPTLEFFPTHHHDWLRANHWDPTTIITTFDKLDLNLRKQYLSDEDWAIRDVGDMKLFTNGTTDIHTSVIMCEKNHAGKTWTMISGHEKPWLVYKDGTWWQQQQDYAIRQIFGMGDKIQPFFLEPQLLLKAAHMLKRDLQRLPIKPVNGMRAEDLYKGTTGYKRWCQACGRHDELTYGVSSLQKIKHREFISINFGTSGKFSDLDLSTAEPILREKYLDKDPIAMKYIRGLYNASSDSEFNRWMVEAGYRPEGKILKTALLWSKAYNLGP